MDVNRREICKSLIEWFNVLMADDEFLKPTQRTDLSDGVAMARALHKLSPDFFNDAWLSKIKIDVGTNWRLKASNLKKVVESLYDYYIDVLNNALSDAVRPDVMKISEKNDKNELGRLLQLILGCAINCPLKMDYIRQIMELEESLQQNIMQAIQDLESTLQGTMASKSSSLSISNFDSKILQDERDRLAQKCHEAERQIALLLEEKSSMQQELNKLQREVDMYVTPKDHIIGDDGASLGPAQPGSTRYNEMRRQLETLKDELLQAEAQRDDFKIRASQLENDVFTLRSKLDNSSHAQEEITTLKDELDAMRETNDKLKANEAIINTYKKKLEDYSDLKRQVKQLEDQNEEYVQQTRQHEENIKKLSALKGQVELYKKEIQELHSRLDTEINKTMKIEFELDKSNAQLMAVQRQKDALIAERDSLQEAYDQLSATHPTTAIAGSNAISNELTLLGLREKTRMLEDENKALREGQGGQTALAQMLDDANQRSEKLREQLKLANQKILSLQSGSTDDAVRSAETSQESSDSKVSQSDVGRLQLRNAHLEATLLAREQELTQMDMKYRKYAEKAKEVIKSLEKNPDLHDSNDIILTSSPIRPTMTPVEERLMTTAYYNLSIACQRDVVDARLALLNGGQSFLSRQRQPVPRKPIATKRPK